MCYREINAIREAKAAAGEYLMPGALRANHGESSQRPLSDLLQCRATAQSFSSAIDGARRGLYDFSDTE